MEWFKACLPSQGGRTKHLSRQRQLESLAIIGINTRLHRRLTYLPDLAVIDLRFRIDAGDESGEIVYTLPFRQAVSIIPWAVRRASCAAAGGGS